MRVPELKNWVESRNDRLAIIFAGVSLVIAGFFLFFFNSNRWRNDVQAIGLLKTDGMIRRRHAKSLSWETVGGRSEVYLRDILYTPKGTSASITLSNNKVLELQPDSMVEFDEYTISAVSVTLLSGQLTGEAVVQNLEKVEMRSYHGSQKLFTYMPDVEPLQLRYEELRDSVTEHMIKNLRYEAIAPWESGKGNSGRISDYKIEQVTPHDVRYSLTSTRWLAMMWTPVPVQGVVFHLEVSKDEVFRHPWNYETKTNRLPVQFKDDGSYFWRVRASSGSESIVSTVKRFVVSSASAPNRSVASPTPEAK